MASNAVLSLESFFNSHGNHDGSLRIRARFPGSTYASGRLLLRNAIPSYPKSFGPAGLNLSSLGWAVDGDSFDGNLAGLRNAIVRYGPVTGATISSGIVTVTIATGHDLLPGETVFIRQVLGSTEINGRFQVIKTPSDTTFTIAVASITGFSASANSIVEVQRPFPDMAISGASLSNGVPTFTTSVAHELAVGDVVYITRITGLTGTTFQRLAQVVSAVPSSTTFRLQSLNGVGGTATTTNAKVILQRSFRVFGQLFLVRNHAIGISAVSTANPAVYDTNVAHGLRAGDVVESSVLGTAATALNGRFRVRSVTDADTVTLETLPGALVSGAGSSAFVAGNLAGKWPVPEGGNWESEGILTIPVNQKQGVWQGPLNL